ncbi:TetR/AcrR family transcriptional regulator [Sporolactobacillus shoreicorticis]|uniref:TetR/AcrR family transcriptional regulator n=1 Tax=Sporolactobacillus shoreicorticis TaxID=1923877 RepID=A0ABW5S0H4_9BACL|nr:TetR/AcrR family transcriptional regulator [Sporolactobacillus shoreicorticis]MCO7124537.1 TetR/AcrR family transcriptional regulator [Sporolactobacillus shoreicorticis]
MDEPKEKAILDAAIHEFAIKGFDRASTNQIAKSSGVSKGLIFHYYDSKEKLFEESVDYAIRFTMKEMDFENWKLSSDMLADIRKICQMEIRVYKKYPDIYQFMMNAFAQPPERLTDKMINLYNELNAMTPGFIEGMIGRLDLKDDVNRDLLKSVFLCLFNDYSSQTMAYLKKNPNSTIDDLRPIIDRIISMIEMILRGLTKNN